jgi:hypothetical protein
MTPETLRRILTPEPGTALWRAKEYGIDLTVVARNAGEDEEARARRAIRAFRAARAVREARERSTA